MKHTWLIACVLLFLSTPAKSDITCDVRGVCWALCKPIEVMVTDNRMHIKCQPAYSSGLVYLAFPADNRSLTPTPQGGPTYTEATHKMLFEQYLVLGKTALLNRKQLWVGFSRAATNNPHTEAWGCRVADCSMIRELAITARPF